MPAAAASSRPDEDLHAPVQLATGGIVAAVDLIRRHRLGLAIAAGVGVLCRLALAQGREIPHIYPHSGLGTKLCLWLPGSGEWSPQMRLSETYLPWTAEWLDYFEDWLITDSWAGGGAHPAPRRKRWDFPRALRVGR